MFLRRFKHLLSKRWSPWNQPSAALMKHVDGLGNGFEMDDLLSTAPEDPNAQQLVMELVAINDRYKSDAYPIGVSNPASFRDIRLLAERLQREGR